MSTSTTRATPSKDRYSTRMRRVWTIGKVSGRLRGCNCRTFHSFRLCRTLKREFVLHPKVSRGNQIWNRREKKLLSCQQRKTLRPSCTRGKNATNSYLFHQALIGLSFRMNFHISIWDSLIYRYDDSAVLSLRSNRFIKVSSGESLTWYAESIFSYFTRIFLNVLLFNCVTTAKCSSGFHFSVAISASNKSITRISESNRCWPSKLETIFCCKYFKWPINIRFSLSEHFRLIDPAFLTSKIDQKNHVTLFFFGCLDCHMIANEVLLLSPWDFRSD